jgi:hypothetical protein
MDAIPRHSRPSVALGELGTTARKETPRSLEGICPRRLDSRRVYRYTKSMAQSFLVFEFGSDEELAQQARHRVDGWKQGFRLGKKLLLKFARSEAPQGEEKASAKPGRKKPDNVSAKENIQLIIRLDFSDHERLSHQRWLERIPSEVPFKDAQSQIIRQNDAEFAGTAERFDSLP